MTRGRVLILGYEQSSNEASTRLNTKAETYPQAKLMNKQANKKDEPEPKIFLEPKSGIWDKGSSKNGTDLNATEPRR